MTEAKCPVCGADQGEWDEAIDLPRCKGELKHPIYFYRPAKHWVGPPPGDEYPTAGFPQTEKNPSWTF